MQSKATSVQAYLDSLPPDRREALCRIREVILENLDPKLQECMQYGMIGYSVPHSVYPAGYHCDPKQPLPYAGLASQKNHMSLYLMGCYGSREEEARLRKEWLAAGKKLDMGKSCIRFKKLDDVPLEVIGDAIKRLTAAKFIRMYEEALAAPRPDAAARRTSKKTAKTTAKKVPAKPAGAKKAPARSAKSKTK